MSVIHLAKALLMHLCRVVYVRAVAHMPHDTCLFGGVVSKTGQSQTCVF